MLNILLVAVIVLTIIVIILYKKLNGKSSGIGRILPGTNTVVIDISLDKNGIPQQNHKEIELSPGKVALFAGPDKFEIIFKNRKTPNTKIENISTDGTVSIKIPSDIFKQTEFADEYRKNKSLRFDYAIRVNDKELDPPMHIRDPQ